MKNSEKMICNKLVSLSYFEAGRSPRKRSLLDVNEHFEGEPDAEIAKLDNLFLLADSSYTRQLLTLHVLKQCTTTC